MPLFPSVMPALDLGGNLPPEQAGAIVPQDYPQRGVLSRVLDRGLTGVLEGADIAPAWMTRASNAMHNPAATAALGVLGGGMADLVPAFRLGGKTYLGRVGQDHAEAVANHGFDNQSMAKYELGMSNTKTGDFIPRSSGQGFDSTELMSPAQLRMWRRRMSDM